MGVDRGCGIVPRTDGRGVKKSMEIATLIAAVVGGATGLVNAVAVILVNGKVDRLTGRVDVLQEAVMQRP